MNVTHSIIGTETLWKQVGGTSKAGLGIKVGIVDSGIDHVHPFLTDSSLSMPAGFPKCDVEENCQFTSNKVIVAREYPKSSDYTSEDKNGHGTHVSGTVAGVHGTSAPSVGGTLSGVAPKAYLGNYNVFPGDTGSASEYDIIDALEDATRDGMDVLNMSLGGGVLPGPDPLADAVNSTVDAGIVVAVAAGNSGPGSETISSPGVAEKALTVGATTNPHFIGIAVGVTDAGVPTELASFGAAVGDFEAYETPVSARYVDWNAIDGLGNGEACEPSLHPDLQGAIALIKRGTCTFTTKVRNAENAGAVGVLLFNQVAGDPVAMGHDGTEPKPVIPAVMVSKDKGLAMQDWYTTNGGGHATVDGSSKSEFITENVDIIAGFSSRGPTPYTYRIKPDVSAPGVNVYSSVPGVDFAMYQGTSMASPHVAGASAVLRQLNPRWSPQQIKSALSSTAKRPVWD
ncbi:MAG: S8 family serine peptidase, partial [Chloroflexota bacterium]|nr:S8 family serine peptidase [Chloroflexota bacterium]